MIRSLILFKGNVQGVGFRYTTRRIAEHYAISGTVRNLSDGSVEVIAEGDKAEIDMFLNELAEQMGHFVRQSTRSDCPATGKYTGFAVTY